MWLMGVKSEKMKVLRDPNVRPNRKVGDGLKEHRQKLDTTERWLFSVLEFLFDSSQAFLEGTPGTVL